MQPSRLEPDSTRRPRAARSLSAALLLLLATAPPVRADVPFNLRIARAARAQVGVTKIYDPAYVRLAYPGGDLPIERGVCADVVVRAFRAVNIDLQVELHRDMKANFRSYPRNWGLRAPDRNIDHRRVPNLMTWFARQGKSVAPAGSRFLPGDVVAWRLGGGLHHIGVVSEKRTADGARPLMIHNIGAGAQEEDVLRAWQIIGHYRY